MRERINLPSDPGTGSTGADYFVGGWTVAVVTTDETFDWVTEDVGE